MPVRLPEHLRQLKQLEQNRRDLTSKDVQSVVGRENTAQPVLLPKIPRKSNPETMIGNNDFDFLTMESNDSPFLMKSRRDHARRLYEQLRAKNRHVDAGSLKATASAIPREDPKVFGFTSSVKEETTNDNSPYHMSESRYGGFPMNIYYDRTPWKPVEPSSEYVKANLQRLLKRSNEARDPSSRLRSLDVSHLGHQLQSEPGKGSVADEPSLAEIDEGFFDDETFLREFSEEHAGERENVANRYQETPFADELSETEYDDYVDYNDPALIKEKQVLTPLPAGKESGRPAGLRARPPYPPSHYRQDFRENTNEFYRPNQDRNSIKKPVAYPGIRHYNVKPTQNAPQSDGYAKVQRHKEEGYRERGPNPLLPSTTNRQPFGRDHYRPPPTYQQSFPHEASNSPRRPEVPSMFSGGPEAQLNEFKRRPPISDFGHGRPRYRHFSPPLPKTTFRTAGPKRESLRHNIDSTPDLEEFRELHHGFLSYNQRFPKPQRFFDKLNPSDSYSNLAPNSFYREEFQDRPTDSDIYESLDDPRERYRDLDQNKHEDYYEAKRVKDNSGKHDHDHGPNHDHDHSPNHDHDHDHSPNHDHDHDHNHGPNHDHDHDHNHGPNRDHGNDHSDDPNHHHGNDHDHNHVDPQELIQKHEAESDGWEPEEREHPVYPEDYPEDYTYDDLEDTDVEKRPKARQAISHNPEDTDDENAYEEDNIWEDYFDSLQKNINDDIVTLSHNSENYNNPPEGTNDQSGKQPVEEDGGVVHNPDDRERDREEIPNEHNNENDAYQPRYRELPPAEIPPPYHKERRPYFQGDVDTYLESREKEREWEEEHNHEMPQEGHEEQQKREETVRDGPGSLYRGSMNRAPMPPRNVHFSYIVPPRQTETNRFNKISPVHPTRNIPRFDDFFSKIEQRVESEIDRTKGLTPTDSDSSYQPSDDSDNEERLRNMETRYVPYNEEERRGDNQEDLEPEYYEEDRNDPAVLGFQVPSHAALEDNYQTETSGLVDRHGEEEDLANALNWSPKRLVPKRRRIKTVKRRKPRKEEESERQGRSRYFSLPPL